ncbi:MAG: type II toxin-antitoxin system prevent-host-death family antitoxin [Betaproteobacteria bacterium]
MTITTLTSRQFNQDASKAKKSAMAGPVFITDRGRPAHVLLTFADYKKITGEHTKIADLLAMPGIENSKLDIPQLRDLAQPADFS